MHALGWLSELLANKRERIINRYLFPSSLASEPAAGKDQVGKVALSSVLALSFYLL